MAAHSCETSVGIASQKTVSFIFRLCYCVIVRDQNLPELSFHPCTSIQPSAFPVTLQSTTHETNHPHFQSLSSPPRIKPTIHISGRSPVHHASNQPSTFPVTLQSTTHQTNHPHFQSLSSPPLIKPTSYLPTCVSLMACSSCGTAVMSFTYNIITCRCDLLIAVRK